MQYGVQPWNQLSMGLIATFYVQQSWPEPENNCEIESEKHEQSDQVGHITDALSWLLADWCDNYSLAENVVIVAAAAGSCVIVVAVGSCFDSYYCLWRWSLFESWTSKQRQ